MKVYVDDTPGLSDLLDDPDSIWAEEWPDIK